MRYITFKPKNEKEVDFALVRDHTIEKIIEAKYADSKVAANLRYFHEKYNFPAVQVVKELKREIHRRRNICC
jgi:hypothetical protein